MISRGHVYFVSLAPTHGREQTGRRPVLVVSSDVINRLPLGVTVVPGTDAKNIKADYPTNVRVNAKDTGLPMDTVFLCFQLRALDPSRFLDPSTRTPPLVATLSAAKMREVDAALRLVLDLGA